MSPSISTLYTHPVYTQCTYTHTPHTCTHTHEHTLLQACDRGTPRMCSNTTVSVTVEDFNDEAPRFDLVQYRVDVFEDTPVDVILQPVATDGDSGTNAIIRYSLQVRLCV